MKQTNSPNRTCTNRFPVLLTMIALIALSVTACKKGVADKPAATHDEEPVAITEATETHTYTKIFDGGTDGYHSFRIPSIVRTNANTLIAFVEGRMATNRDYGNI